MFDDLNRLLHDVRLVALDLVHFFPHDQLLDPAGIEIDMVATAAAEVREMFNGETKATRTGRADHDPVAAFREKLVAELMGELLVIVFVIFPANPLLRQTGRASGLKHIERAALVGVGDKTFVLLIAQPFVLKMGELDDLIGGFHLLAGIPAGAFFPVEPERASRFVTEMPRHHFADTVVELCFGFVRGHGRAVLLWKRNKRGLSRILDRVRSEIKQKTYE